MADFGMDVGGVTDIDPTFRRISGGMVLATSLLRRFRTRRGSLEWAPDDGFDLRLLLSRAISDAEIPLLQKQIALEAEKDERVQSADCLLEINARAESMKVTILADTAQGPFPLVFTVDKLSVEILRAG